MSEMEDLKNETDEILKELEVEDRVEEARKIAKLLEFDGIACSHVDDWDMYAHWFNIFVHPKLHGNIRFEKPLRSTMKRIRILLNGRSIPFTILDQPIKKYTRVLGKRICDGYDKPYIKLEVFVP